MREDEILDRSEEKKRVDPLSTPLYVTAVVLFLYWFAADYLYWPFGKLALIIGIGILFFIMTRRFLETRKNGLYQYFYFGGKVTLLIAIFLKMEGHPAFSWLLWVAVGCFAVGLLSVGITKNKD